MHPRLERWLQRLESLDPRRIELGLARVQRVLSALPLGARPKLTLLVGGTNGKGSCVAYLEAMLSAAGYRVGAYTSPHLVHYHERFRIDGRLIRDDELLPAFEAVETARGDVPLTYFEFATLAAVSAFDRVGCDAWILEVGLGGRLDAVNAVEPDGSLVVSVALDHLDWLGPNRQSIGLEKAGIYRPGKPAICADPRPPGSLVQHARDIGADLWLAGRDYRVNRQRQHWSYRSRGMHLHALELPPLAGAVQLRNAAASLALLEACLGADAVAPMAAALGQARLLGRFQRHLDDGVEWVLDVAHNPAAARALAETLARTKPAGRTLAVAGFLSSKDHEGALRWLSPHVDEWWLAPAADGGGGEVPPAALQALLGQWDKRAVVAADVVAACVEARAQAHAGDRILVVGSFHVVGPALAWLGLSSPSV